MKFLYKIEAIHPRGRKFEREGPPKEKSGFAFPKGKTLKARLDWIASSVNDLITDYNFSASTNKLMHEVQVHHSLITDSMPIDQKLNESLKMMAFVPKLASEIQRLYAKGALPEGVDRKMIHTFLEESKEIEKQTEALQEKLKEYQGFEKSLQKLGY